MKLKASLAAGATLTCAMIGALTPSAAFADSSASFSQATICPGESVTLTANGISDGSTVFLTSPEYFRVQFPGAPASLSASINTGTQTWDYWSVYQGSTYTIEVITGGTFADATLGTVLTTTSLEVLTQCATPAPGPEAEAEALPNTGASSDQITALALGGAALAFGGVVLARRARSSKATR
jgi:LPXTG-motif cell wall-anchored protein